MDSDYAVTAACAAGGLALLLVLRRVAVPASSDALLTSAIGLHDEPGCVACAKGGYGALSAVALPDGAATRGSKAAFDGIADEDCVTVRVCAAGVNYADVCIRWGLYTSWNRFGGGRRPGQDGGEGGIRGDVPGFEFAGTVEQIGKGSACRHLKLGDAVFGVSLFGAYSSRILVPAHQVFRRPEGVLSPCEAAAMPCVAMTAWFAVQQQASPIAPGRWVLVHSAAGGVGSMLVQMSKIKGWKVVAVVGSSHKVDECKRLGADAVIDKSTVTDLWGAARKVTPGGFAAIFDANGVATLSDSYAHLAPCGKLIVYGFHTMLPKEGGVINPLQWIRMGVQWLRTPRFNPLAMVPANKSVLAFNLSFLFDQKDLLADAMDELMGWLSSGQLKMPKVTEYKLDEVRKAHAALESGKTVGKLVLVPP